MSAYDIIEARKPSYLSPAAYLATHAPTAPIAPYTIEGAKLIDSYSTFTLRNADGKEVGTVRVSPPKPSVWGDSADPASVNWSAHGSVDVAEARAYATLIQVASDYAEMLDEIAAPWLADATQLLAAHRAEVEARSERTADVVNRRREVLRSYVGERVRVTFHAANGRPADKPVTAELTADATGRLMLGDRALNVGRVAQLEKKESPNGRFRPVLKYTRPAAAEAEVMYNATTEGK